MLQDDNKDDIAQIICDEKVPFVTIGAGNPIPWFEPFHQKESNVFLSFPM